ncbi:FkbM family methyltransferase [Bradyrhizobium yuanmingense]|uniref:FkbM family methyltransferase n=1 Tax=Bradyrhizobium yuanmingense TaxID=108015 RepID=UPI0023BA2BCB|nr:FkbM family methyltransferase [Bradyrhizobium yuanmingense]MDF0518085.1 FkbM family methyltransferase [Bradyrhizobium yuanmingense]
MKSLNSLIKKSFSALGFSIRRKIPALAGLKLLPKVKTIIDVGVAYGTPDLYAHFPDAELILVEGSPEFHSFLQSQVLGSRKGRLVKFAVGSSSGSGYLRLNGPGSSLLTASRMTGLYNKELETVEVQIRRLDELVSADELKHPTLLKIDTEGFELEVLKGSEALLPNIDFIIAEVSLIKRFQKSYQASEIINWLQEREFQIFQIIDCIPDSKGIFRYADFVFARREFIDRFNATV